MRRFWTLLTVLGGCLLGTAPAYAWDPAGYMVVASIAWQDLGPHPSRDRAVEILKRHPFCPRWQGEARHGIDPGEYLFMRAAAWSDDVRQDVNYRHEPWHVIPQPFVPPGETTKPSDLPMDNLVTSAAYNLDLLQGRGSLTDEERAVAPSWLLHLVGDVHQPLATIALFTKDYPYGDRGGEAFYARLREGGPSHSLRELWDGWPGRSLTPPEAHPLAQAVMKRHPRASFAQLGPGSPQDFAGWAKESYELAREQVYRNGTLKGSSKQDQSPVLPAGYAGAARAGAEPQIALAGYRLADWLKRALPPRGI